MKNIFRSRFRYKWVLAIVILLSSLAIIGINYYSIRMLTSVRGFRNAQFVYVGSQKNAIRGLSLYVYNQKPEYYDTFSTNIAIPIADSIARTAWETGQSYAVIKKAYLEGNNYPDDLEDIAWLLQNFSWLSHLKEGLHYWKLADARIGRLHALGKEIYNNGSKHTFNQAEKEHYSDLINQLCKQLDYNEDKFSYLLMTASNNISHSLLIINIVFILLVFLNIGLFFDKLMRQLNNALQRIEAQDKAKEEFLSVASHELKSPITFMKASIQILERFAKNTPETKKIHPFIVNSAKQVDRLNHLVKELLDVTKIQSGRLILNKEEFHIDELIWEAVEEKNHLQTHTLTIKNLKAVKVKADPNRIYQVLENLLSNAMKYSQPHTEIIVWSETVGDQIKVSIKDAGKGIPEEKQSKLFNRYYRVETTQHAVQGLGLGLYICSEIIKNHDGKIGVYSTIDQGSTFWFTLPILSQQAKSAPISKSIISY